MTARGGRNLQMVPEVAQTKTARSLQKQEGNPDRADPEGRRKRGVLDTLGRDESDDVWSGF